MGRLLGRFFAPSFKQEIPSGTPDGTRVAFTLAVTPASGTAVDVFLNGVRQTLGSDFTVAGTTITMTAAPTAQQEVTARYVAAN